MEDPMDWSDEQLIESIKDDDTEVDYMKVTIHRHNVVGNMSMAISNDPGLSKIDLFKVLRAYGDTVTYKKRKFAAIIFKLKFPHATLLVFDKFSVVCVGSHAPELLKLALQVVRLMIESLGPRASMKKLSIDNVVAGTNIGFRINLQKLYDLNQSSTSYLPDDFPGIILNAKDTTRVRCLGFSTGNLVMMGATSSTEMLEELPRLMPLLKECEEKDEEILAPKKKKSSSSSKTKVNSELLTQKEVQRLVIANPDKEEFESAVREFKLCKNRIAEVEKKLKGKNKNLIKVLYKLLEDSPLSEIEQKRLKIGDDGVNRLKMAIFDNSESLLEHLIKLRIVSSK